MTLSPGWRAFGWLLAAVAVLGVLDVMEAVFRMREVLGSDWGLAAGFGFRAPANHCGILGWFANVSYMLSILWLALSLKRLAVQRWNGAIRLDTPTTAVLGCLPISIFLSLLARYWIQTAYGVLIF